MINDRRGEEILRCPRCADRLEAMYLDEFEDEDKIKCQRISWVCRGLRNDSCDFPLDMPPEVFWTKRTIQQRCDDFTPLPNFHMLPRRYRYLYPTLFPQNVRKRKARPPPASPAFSSPSSLEPMTEEEERRKGHERSLSPASSASGATIISRTASRLSLCSEISAASSKHRSSIEDRLSTPEREQFRALCVPAAPLIPRLGAAQSTPTSKKNTVTITVETVAPEPETPPLSDELASIFEGLTDDLRASSEELNEEQAAMLKKLSKPGVPDVAHVIPNSPNATLPIAVAPHSEQASKCLDTVGRETKVGWSNRTSDRVRERNRNIKTAIEKRTKKISDTTANTMKVTDLDNVHIVAAESGRKKVEIFNGPQSTLQSLIYMRYATDDFLHAVQRKMTKEGLVEPFTAMTPQQKRLTTQMADSLREQTFSSSKAKGPNWLARSKLSHMQASEESSTSTESCEAEEPDNAKRAKTESCPTAVPASYGPKLTQYVPRRVRMTDRLTAVDMKQHMLSKIESRMQEDVSSRIGLRSGKSEKKAPISRATPPRICSSPSSASLVGFSGDASITIASAAISAPPVTTVTEESSTLSSTQSLSTDQQDDLSDIPPSMRMNMFDDPELNALVNRKLRKIAQENIIYDKTTDALYVPAHIAHEDLNMTQQEPLPSAAGPSQHQPPTQDLDYLPTGLLVNPNGELNGQWGDYDFMNPVPDQLAAQMQATGSDTMFFDDGATGAWRDDLGFGIGEMVMDSAYSGDDVQPEFIDFQPLSDPNQDGSWHYDLNGGNRPLW